MRKTMALWAALVLVPSSCMLQRDGTVQADSDDSTTNSSQGGQFNQGGQVNQGAQGNPGGQSSAQGGGGTCATVSDCPPSGSDCVLPVCDNNTCTTSFADSEATCAEGLADVCDGAGNCVRSNGTRCADDDECLSVFCTDGICCESACDSACEACAGDDGACTPTAPASTDNLCAGDALCDGLGNCADGSAAWANSFWLTGGTHTITAVARDSNDDILVAGYFAEDIRLDVATTDADYSNAGSNGSDVDGFLLKLDSSGNYVCSFQYPSDDEARPRSIAIGPNDSVVVSGDFTGNATDFGDGDRDANGTDVFVVRYTNGATGVLTFEWAQHFGGAGDQFNRSAAIDTSMNVSGDVILSGRHSSNSTTFAPLGSLGNTAKGDMYLLRLNGSGEPQAADSFGSSERDEPAGLIVTSDGSIILAGTTGDADINFSNDAANVLPNIGAADVFLVRFDSTFSHTWSHMYGGDDTDSVGGIALMEGSATPEILITGHFRKQIEFVSGEPLSNPGDEDLYVASVALDGTEQWALKYGDDQSQRGRGIGADAAGNVTVWGDFRGTLNFGGAAIQSESIFNLFAAKLANINANIALSTQPDHLWSHAFGSDASDEADGGNAGALPLVVDSGGAAIAIGRYSGANLDFGPGEFPDPAGESTGFVVKLEP